MAGLPEGWEADYDGTRWFYRYKATGLTQWTFPQPGDEFPNHCDPSEGPLSLDPEERLASERQLKRRGTEEDAENRAELHGSESVRAPHDPDKPEMSATGYFDPEDFMAGVGYDDDETPELPGDMDRFRSPVGVVPELVGMEGVKCAEELAPVELDAAVHSAPVTKQSSPTQTGPSELSIEKTVARLATEETPRSTSAPPEPVVPNSNVGANFVYAEQDTAPAVPAANIAKTHTRDRSYSALQPGPAVIQNARVNGQPASFARPEISRLQSQENEAGLKRHSLSGPAMTNGSIPQSLRPAGERMVSSQSEQASIQQSESSSSSNTPQYFSPALTVGRPHASTLVSEPNRIENVALRPRSSTGATPNAAPSGGFSGVQLHETYATPVTNGETTSNPVDPVVHQPQPQYMEPPDNSVRNAVQLLRTESTVAPVKPKKQATIARLRRQNDDVPMTPTATFNQIYEVINLVEAKYSPDPEEQGFTVPPLPTAKPEVPTYSQPPISDGDSPKPLNISPRQAQVSPPSEPSPKPLYTSSNSEYSPKPLYIPPRMTRTPQEIPRPIYSLPDDEAAEAPKPVHSTSPKPQEPAKAAYSTSPPPQPQPRESPKPQQYSVELRDEPVSVAPPVVALSYGQQPAQTVSTQDQPRSSSIPQVSPASGVVSSPEHPGTPSSYATSASPQKQYGALPEQVKPAPAETHYRAPSYVQEFVENQFVQSRPVSRLSQNTQGSHGSQDSTGTSTPPRFLNASKPPVGPDGAVIYEMDSMPAGPRQENPQAPPVQYLSAKQLEPRRTSMVTTTTTTTTTEEEGGFKKWARKILPGPIQPRRDSNPRRQSIIPFPAEAFERRHSPPQENGKGGSARSSQDGQQQQKPTVPAVQEPQPPKATTNPAQRSSLPSQANRGSRLTPPRRESPLQSSSLAPPPPQQQLQPSQPIRRRPVSAQILPSSKPEPQQQQQPYRYSQTPPQGVPSSLHPAAANGQGAYAPSQQRPQLRGDPDAVSVCSTESIVLPSPSHQQQQQQQSYQNHYRPHSQSQPPYPQQKQQQQQSYESRHHSQSVSQAPYPNQQYTQPQPQQARPQLPPYPHQSYPQQPQVQQVQQQQYHYQQQQQAPARPPKQQYPQQQQQQPQQQQGLSYQGRQYPAVVAGTYPPVAAPVQRQPQHLQQQQQQQQQAPPPAPLYYHQHTAHYHQQQQQQGRGRVQADYSGNGWGGQ